MKKLRTSLMTWIAIYPTITIILYISEPFLKDMILPIKTLILTVIVVPIMVYWVIPFVKKIMPEKE